MRRLQHVRGGEVRGPHANRPVRRGCHGERFCDRYGYVGSVDTSRARRARGTRFRFRREKRQRRDGARVQLERALGRARRVSGIVLGIVVQNRHPRDSARFGSREEKRLCFFGFLGFRAVWRPRARAVRVRRIALFDEKRERRERARFSSNGGRVPPQRIEVEVFETHRLLDQAHRSRSGVERERRLGDEPVAADEQPVVAIGRKRDARRPRGLPQDTREDLRGRCSPSPGHVVPVPHLDRGLLERPRGRLTQEREARPASFFLCRHQFRRRRARRAERRAQNKSHVFIGFVDTGRHGSIHRHAGKRSFLCRHQFRAAFGERDARDRLGVARQNLPAAVY